MAALGDARTQLMDDFNKMASDAESLLRAMAAVPGEKASALRSSVEDIQAAARQRVRELQGMAREHAAAADTYVHENPWPLIGAAAAIGLVVGLSVRRS